MEKNEEREKKGKRRKGKKGRKRKGEMGNKEKKGKKENVWNQGKNEHESIMSRLSDGRHPFIGLSFRQHKKTSPPSLHPPWWRCFLCVLWDIRDLPHSQPAAGCQEKRDPIKVGPSLAQNMGSVGEAMTLWSSCEIIRETVNVWCHSWLSGRERKALI